MHNFSFVPMLECTSDSCPLDSKCLNGTCQCLSDTFFSNGRCEKGKNISSSRDQSRKVPMRLFSERPFASFSPLIFFHSAQVYPGQLHLTSLTFRKEMFNRSSSEFRSTAREIEKVVHPELTQHVEYLYSDTCSCLIKTHFLFHSSMVYSKVSQGT